MAVLNVLTTVVAALTSSLERPREAVELASSTAPPSPPASVGEGCGLGDICSCFKGGDRCGGAECSE